MSDRYGDWMETFTGRRFWPLDPREDEVCIEDIAHALSMLCRFGGHCREFYSVAQHSCHVADMVAARSPEHALVALMHDAEEAYVGDIIRPIKRSYPPIAQAGSQVWEVITRRFKLPLVLPDVVKWADNVMLRNEHAQLMDGRNEWPSCDQADGPNFDVRPVLLPTQAEHLFIRKFKEYGQ